jgi:very-long-chain enoyl-CoA reductase
MPLPTALLISSCYLFYVTMLTYAQHHTRGLPEPATDTIYPGALVFAVGVAGNFYHHHLLSRLRAATATSGGCGDDRGYKIPKGGLFELVACPHYLFEIVTFVGLAMIAQTAFALALAVGTAAFLACRSCATRRWYATKFEEFPTRVRALVPYVL